MQLIKDFVYFDVMLCLNLFGDIIFDECVMIMGFMGLLFLVSFNEDGFGMYELVGGLVFDIVGKGIVNFIV